MFPYFTSFVGRDRQLFEVRELLASNRLVTVNGPGGVGKTRLAFEIAAALEFTDGIWIVDLGPAADPAVVPTIAAHALGLIDQPNISTISTLKHFIGDRKMLMVLDNCEHLLEACCELVVVLLTACPGLIVLTTSRESLGVSGEVVWGLPSLSLADEAIELFVERARLVQPTFEIADDNFDAVTEICRRLDGIPLAIELAAARVRSLSPTEIADSLDDRFRLLTGGRGATPRQQTLRASMDWSHDLLPESEQVLLRRLAVFPGTFDLAAVRTVAGDDREPFEVLDQLTLLADKSLLVVEMGQHRARYRLLETVREYAAEKLAKSGEIESWTRHLDHYVALGARLDTPECSGDPQCVEQAEIEIDNFRAAFMWSREEGRMEVALKLASSLQPVWFGRGREREGLAWLESILDAERDYQAAVAPGVWARALADKVMLSTLLAASSIGTPAIVKQAQQALAIARDIDDPAVLARALAACGWSSGYDPPAAQAYFREALGLVRALDDKWTLSQILYWQLVGTCMAGDPPALRAAAEQAFELADAIGDRFVARQCRLWVGAAYTWESNLARALAQSREVTAEAEQDNDVVTALLGLYQQAFTLAHQDACAARAVADACIRAAAELGGVYEDCGSTVVVYAALAAGDVAVVESREVSCSDVGTQGRLPVHYAIMAQLALVRGDIDTAQTLADEAVASTTGWHLVMALQTRARVAIAQERFAQARDDIHAAVNCGVNVQAYLGMADLLELLADLAVKVGSHDKSARLFGAAAAQRERTGEVRFQVWDGDYRNSVTYLHDAMGGEDFESAWAEGTAMPIDEAISYAQRGRGKRERPVSGWASLTPAERNVVGLVTEGLTNKEIGRKLFLSPRTVQTHLTNVYAKLSITSRVQLTQEAARHS